MRQMRTRGSSDTAWRSLLSKLTKLVDLDTTARETGALIRRRAIADGATLLRLALAYGPGGLSLRSAAAWAGINDIACLSDVGLLKRLRGAADWLGLIAGALLHNVPTSASGNRRLQIVDGTSVSAPGSSGTDWRLHATYDPMSARFTHLELSDVHGGESFSRVPLQAGDILLGDRAYARAPALQQVVSAGADFIVRMAWSNVRLTWPDGTPVDLATVYSDMKPDDIADRDVLVEYSGPGCKCRGKALFRARLIIRCKDEAATRPAEHRCGGCITSSRTVCVQPFLCSCGQSGYNSTSKPSIVSERGHPRPFRYWQFPHNAPENEQFVEYSENLVVDFNRSGVRGSENALRREWGLVPRDYYIDRQELLPDGTWGGVAPRDWEGWGPNPNFPDGWHLVDDLQREDLNRIELEEESGM